VIRSTKPLYARLSRLIWSIVAIAVSTLVASYLVFDVALDYVCAYGGCTGTERTTASEMVELAVAIFLFAGVPAVVAIVRRDARWLVVPVIIGLLIALIFGALKIL